MADQTGRLDVRIVLASPAGSSLGELHRSGLDVDRLVVACFSRDADERKRLLDGLRHTAALAAMPDRDAGRADESPGEDASDLDLLHALVRRRAQAGEGYHAYTLRVGVPPYSAGCLISFVPLDTEAARIHVARAQQLAQGQRRRVLDAFGLGRDDGEG